MNDLISVIVPVYRVEAYLNRCVQSIVDQTYQNLEIILVDDGSPDQCPQICDHWAKTDDRISVIHKRNGGIPDARNAGIARASGSYIAFVDSDDFVDERFISCLYEQIRETGAEISCIHMQTFNAMEQIQRDTEQYETEILSGAEAINALLDPTGFRSYTWNKMYKRALFEGVQFPVGRMLEDLAVTYRLFELCNRISYRPAKLYFYYQRPDSCLHDVNRKTQMYLDWYTSGKEMYLYVRQKYPDMQRNYQYFNEVILYCYPLLQQKEAQYARSEFKRNAAYGMIAPNRKERVKLFLFRFSKTLYCRVWKMWQKNE